MRYFIDTHIFVFLCRDHDELSRNVRELVLDYENTLVMSVESVRELLMLINNGKVQSKDLKSYDDIKEKMQKYGIKIRHTSDTHLETLSRLIPVARHSDPADLMIIAQAITEKIPLISSDTKFPLYTRHGLDFIFNDRTK